MGLFDPLVSRPPSTKLSARDSSLSEEEIAKIDRASCFDIVTRCTNSALFSHHFDNAATQHCFDSSRIRIQIRAIHLDNAVSKRSKTDLNRANLVERRTTRQELEKKRREGKQRRRSK